MALIYKTRVEVKGGRAGHAKSDDGRLDLALIPPNDAAPDRMGVNPEQLFAAGYAACFESGLRGVARRAGRPLTDASVAATVSLVSREAGGYALEVTLEVQTVGISEEEAKDFASRVHNSGCPYSNAVRGNIDVVLRVKAT